MSIVVYCVRVNGLANTIVVSLFDHFLIKIGTNDHGSKFFFFGKKFPFE
jgi:hypothetical protein